MQPYKTLWNPYKIRQKPYKTLATQYIAADQYVAICENTTRLSETGKTFYLLKPPNISHCLKNTTRLQATDPIFCTVWKHNTMFENTGEHFKLLKHTQYLAISEDTPSLPPTVEYLNHWSHQICDNVSEYHKFAGHGVKFELLKPPNILQPPNIWRYLKIQQDCQKRIKLLIVWSHQISGNVWKYHRIGGHGAKI